MKDSLDLLESCTNITDSTNSVCEIVSNYFRPLKWTDAISSNKNTSNNVTNNVTNNNDSDSYHCLSNALHLLHFNSIQIKITIASEVLKKLTAYQNILDIGPIRVLLRYVRNTSYQKFSQFFSHFLPLFFSIFSRFLSQ